MNLRYKIPANFPREYELQSLNFRHYIFAKRRLPFSQYKERIIGLRFWSSIKIIENYPLGIQIIYK
jgi:hypothetical protein